jgi:hypothetical protein
MVDAAADPHFVDPTLSITVADSQCNSIVTNASHKT